MKHLVNELGCKKKKPDSLPVNSEPIWPAQSGVYNGQGM